jgi:glucose/arabinose dehydrogenase
MNKLAASTFGLCTFILFSCGSGSDTAAQNRNPNAPVETNAPNSNYKPAFAGQTRIAGVHTKTPYEWKMLTKDLRGPWGIRQLPDGRFLITERGGTMRIAKSNGELSAPITGLPAVNSQGQGGLLGLAIDPDFAHNRTVYWCFSEKLPEGNLTALAKGNLSKDEKQMENVKVLWRATPAYNGVLHYGGRVVIDKTGNLIFSTGERSDLATRPQAQDLNSDLGKTIRVTKDGQPAPGNPFAGRAGARPEIYTWGHRNVQGLAFNPLTGDLWEDEFGPRGGDELNRLEPGKNYGWATITYGLEYSGDKVGEGIQQKEGLEQPVYYWDPVLSPSGLTFYTSDIFPEWKGNVFICGLSSQHIARLVLKNNRVVGEEQLLEKEGKRFRDITQGSDGALYAVTDEGRLYRISKK